MNNKDAPTTIEVPIDNDNKITIFRTDPFGLIYMKLDNGTLPQKFQGAYTNYEYAREDALRYIDQRKNEIEKLSKAKTKAA